MTSIPSEESKGSKEKAHYAGSNNNNKRTKGGSFRLHIMSLVAIASLLFAYYNLDLIKSKTSNVFTANNQQAVQQSVQTLEINEEEYLQLGLTPTPPLQVTTLDTLTDIKKTKTYHGRFLHITDIHPDEDYLTGSDIGETCHRGHPKKSSKRRASKYGDATMGCDAPIVLMDDTLKWIEENLKDKIDFVIWTGDNIRHDNDRKIPRTELHIFDMNTKVAKKFIDIFHTEGNPDPRAFDVPIIPSLGNNDVYPHNLFSPGPTLQTRELWNIWQSFVPEEQLHIFEKGAYFFQEVIPNELAVLSVNTLYWFKANPLVDSCDSKKDPGYQLFRWLGVVLQELRERNMKVWLSGHVPPLPKNYDYTCYRKYAIWLHEYRDIIVGGLYGHMNVDHFIPVDSQTAYNSYIEGLSLEDLEELSGGDFLDYFADEIELPSNEEDDDEDNDREGEISLNQQYLNFGVNISEPDLAQLQALEEAHLMGAAPSGKEEYMKTVRQQYYSKVKSKKNSGIQGERYALTFVAGSVIPTFNPAFRVWEYDISGLGAKMMNVGEVKPWDEFFKELEMTLEDELDEALAEENQYFDEDNELEIQGKKKKKKKNKGKKSKPDLTLPPKKPDNLPNGPAYSRQLFTPLKYIQYYLDLEKVNSGEKKFAFEVEYTSKDEPYNLESITVEEMLDFARDLGNPVKSQDSTSGSGKGNSNKGKKEKKLQELWDSYVKHAFVSSGYHD